MKVTTETISTLRHTLELSDIDNAILIRLLRRLYNEDQWKRNLEESVFLERLLSGIGVQP